VKRLLATALLLGALLAGCASHHRAEAAPAAAAQTGRVPPAQWEAQLSKPVYKSWTATVHYIPAEGGATLSLTLYLPDGLPAGATVPTVLEITPYDAPDATTAAGMPDPGPQWSPYVLAGAAFVAADARGTNGSSGCLDFGGSLDRSDARTFAAWIRAQPWSDGRIVTDGLSHPGMGSVVAHAAIPGLAGAMAAAPVVSYYQDEWEQGAKYEDQVNGEGYQEVELAPGVDKDPADVQDQAATCTGRTLLDFNSLDGAFGPLWQDRDLSRHSNATGAPILLEQGFIDENVHPDHVEKYWEALPADYPKYVIWGFWYHGYPDMAGYPGAADARAPVGTFDDIRHRWFDQLLFGTDNGALREPHVVVEDSTGAWHEGSQWPLEPSEQVRLWPAGGDLATSAPATAGGASYPDLPGAQRGSWTGAHVAFRTAPLAHDELVNGAPTLHLVASSSADQTKWVAYLLDEAPDGSWQHVSHGYADSHTWGGDGSDGSWRAIAPGQAYNWTIHLFPTATVVPAGHRLTLLLASEDSRLATLGPHVASLQPPGCFADHRGGCYDPSGIVPSSTAGRATNTVLTGPQGTWLELAWVDPALTAKPPFK